MPQALAIVKSSPALIRAAEPIFAAWAKLDFAAASAWARTAPPAMQAWAHKGLLETGSPVDLLAFAETLVSSRTRSNFQESVLGKLVLQDPTQTLEKLDLLPPNSQSSFVSRHLQELLQHEDSALISYLGRHQEIRLGVHPNDFARLQDWPTEVAERLLNLLPKSPAVAQKLVEVKSETILKRKLSAPETYEQLLALHQDEASAATTLVKRWLELPQKDQEGQRWLEAQPSNIQQAVLSQLQGYCSKIGVSSPEVLFPILAASFAKAPADKISSYQDNLRYLVLVLSQKKSPEELVKWTDSLPLNSVTEIAKVATAETWLNSDPLAASAWVRTWPQGKQKEQAATHIVLSTAADDPEAAIKWLEVIQDPAQRDTCISRVVEKLTSFNPVQARLWVDQISDPKVRARLKQAYKMQP